MAVWKRYNGKRVKGEGPKGKGTWIVEFRLRGHYVKEAIPEARTKAEAEQVQTQIKRAIFDDKYNRAAGTKDFAEFVDEVFVPWAKDRSAVGRMTRSARGLSKFSSRASDFATSRRCSLRTTNNNA